MKLATVLALATLCLAAIPSGCGPEPAAQAQGKPPAGKVTKAEDSSVARLAITEQARERLGLRTAPVKLESVRRTRVLTGVVQRASDGEVVLKAPFAGVVHAPSGGMLRAGTRVLLGRELCSFDARFSPLERAQLVKTRADQESARSQAAAAVERARVREAAARIALDRSTALLSQDAGSARANDEARAEHNFAQADLAAAMELVLGLSVLRREYVSDGSERILMRAGFDAQILDVAVSDGQSVEAGAILMSLAREEPLWLRVPIHSADVGRIQIGRDVTWTTAAAGETPRVAHPIDAPSSANATLATVDAWYAIDAGREQLRPGQRLEVTLTEYGDSEALAVPWPAVLYDLHGQTWVYVQVAELAYERRRIQIERRVDELAVLARGPAAGTEVVIEAAAELFGLEFGSGK